MSAFHNHELLNELIAFGVDVNIKTVFNFTSLMFVIANLENVNFYNQRELSKCHKTVIALLNNGADINSYDDEGKSPLHIACRIGSHNTVKLLLDNGADVNSCMEETGASPLSIAYQNGRDNVVKLLLTYGAITPKNKTGICPLFQLMIINMRIRCKSCSTMALG